MKRHLPKYDAWFYASLVAFANLGLLLPGLRLANFLQQPQVPAQARARLITLFAAALAVWAFSVWTMATIRYDIDGAHLVLRSGPFRRRVPLASIETILRPKHRLSFGAWVPSLDRLEIRYRDGKREHTLVVSPKEKASFLRDVAAAVPGLALRGDQVIRLS